MNAPESHRSYDLFKLLVALILLAIWIVLMLRVPPTAPAAASPVAAAQTASMSPTAAAAQPTATAPAASTATTLPSATQPAPTSTATTPPPTRTATPAPATATPTPTLSGATAAASSTPEAALSPEPTAAPSATLAVVSGPVDCPLALPTRLKMGDNVVTVDNVNMRSVPQIGQNIILTNIRGTQLEIVGGPVCGPYQEGAYLWWQVRRQDGQVGWSAEGGLTGRLYLLQPVP